MDDETPLRPEDEKSLRFLKTLVTVLTVTMIGGVLTVVILLVIRLQTPAPATLPPIPDRIALPPGTTVTAFTQAPGWFAVTTDDDRILIFDRITGALFQEITIARP